MPRLNDEAAFHTLRNYLPELQNAVELAITASEYLRAQLHMHGARCRPSAHTALIGPVGEVIAITKIIESLSKRITLDESDDLKDTKG